MTLAVDYLQALRLRGRMNEEMDRVYGKFDALTAPGFASVAYPIDKDFDKAYPGVGGGPPVIQATNMVGYPAVIVPNGFGENNLPTSIQFTGRCWSEVNLLLLADRYQKASDWHKKRPA